MSTPKKFVAAFAALSTIGATAAFAAPVETVGAGGTHATIAAALASVDAGGEIQVDAAHVEAATVGIAIDVTIRSYDATFTTPTVGATVPAVTISAGNTIELDGLTIDDGAAGGPNGVNIDTAAANVTLTECTITGGNDGIAIAGGTPAGTVLNIDNTSITGSSFSGLAIFAEATTTISNGSSLSSNGGQGVFYSTNNGTFIANDSSFNSNLESGFRHNAGNAGMVATFTNCVFDDNDGRLAGGGGGGDFDNGGGLAIKTDNGGGQSNGRATVVLDSCRITNNTAFNEGAGIWSVDGADLDLTNCIIANNTSTQMGAIRAWNGIHRYVNNTFHNNSAPTVPGIAIDGGFAVTPGNTSYLVNNVFTDHGGDALAIGSFGGNSGAEEVVHATNNVFEASSTNVVSANIASNANVATADVLYAETVNFTLGGSSSALGAGATVANSGNFSGSGVVIPSDDIDGDPRPGQVATAHDAGAQETQAVPVELSAFEIE